MATRLLKYVGRASKQPTQVLDDETVVHLDEVVEVEVREAQRLLRAPGQSDDTAVDWVPAPRVEG